MVKKEDYKTSVLDILKKNMGKNVSRKDIIAQTKISSSRLSEVLSSIKDDGYNIISPPRSGFVQLEAPADSEVLPPIKDSDIRQWLILFLLSKYEKLTFNELLLKTITLHDYTLDHMNILIDADKPTKHYDDANLIKNLRKNILTYPEDESVAKDIVSVTVLRQDLTKLRNQKLVSLVKGKQTQYRLTNAAPYIIPLSGDSLYEFCQRYEESASSTSELLPLKQVYKKITNLINLEGNDINQHRFGKINDISQTQIDTFNSFIKNNYKTNLIQFDSGPKGKQNTYTFAVGILFYSTETSCFYAMGENLTTHYTESRRLDRISNVVTLDKENTLYHKKKYYNILDEMFSSSYEDEAYRVKVLFQAYGNVYKRFSDLCQIRKKATIRPIEDPPEECVFTHVYEDKIRGLQDFARYLRSFGMSVVAVEPPELQAKMIFTYNRIIEKYEEPDEIQNQT